MSTRRPRAPEVTSHNEENNDTVNNDTVNACINESFLINTAAKKDFEMKNKPRIRTLGVSRLQTVKSEREINSFNTSVFSNLS